MQNVAYIGKTEDILEAMFPCKYNKHVEAFRFHTQMTKTYGFKLINGKYEREPIDWKAALS